MANPGWGSGEHRGARGARDSEDVHMNLNQAAFPELSAAESPASEPPAARRSRGRMRTRLLALAVSVAIVSVLGMATAGTASAAPPAAGMRQAVTGTVNGTAATGTLTINRVVQRNGSLQAVGTLTGDLAGGAPRQVFVPVTIQQAQPVTIQQASCDILTLVLGPLHLDLLGLVIDLNQVVLTITGDQGPGNLLGNLLCAIAGLLDGPGGAGGGLAALLTR